MRLVRLLPHRWQKFVHEAFKFGVVGGINTVINYAVFNALALTVFVDGQLKAAVVATLVATLTSYLMNRHWTYRDRPKSALRREYALFFLFNATGLAIELGVLALAKYGLGFTGLLALNIAKTAGVGLATLFRFWSYRTFVFRPHAPATTAAVGPPPAPAPSAVTPAPAPVPAPPPAPVGGTLAAAEVVHPRSTSELPYPYPLPLALDLDPAIEAELEAELAAAELDAAGRRPTTR